MPELQQIALSFAAGGMNAALNPVNLPDSFYSRAVNVQLHNQRPTTRRGIKVLPFVDTDDAVKEDFQCKNFQGGMFYNPIKGQSSISFSKDSARMMASVAGKRYQVITQEIQPGNNTVQIDEISQLKPGNPDLHLAWWYQAENYAIVQDGQADTWIWDGFNDPFFSEGLNQVNKEESELANAATVGSYAHGRVIQVVNARQVIVGDIIHKTDLSDSKNILETKEQVYWATGSYFGPPSSMGNIIAAAILPLRDTQHGHGDLMLHCEDGIFSLNINVYPRTSWVEQPLVKHVLLETGARGPYAIALYDGDQFFRSRHGLQSLRSARGESQLLGNPLNPISEEVHTFLIRDYETYVRFTSVAKWAIARRLLLTVDPWVKGSVRGSRGIVSLNFAPVASATTEKAWEGLMTYPPEIANPIQIINGLFNGRDRTYMFARGDDDRNRIVEFTSDGKNDVLEDGSIERISCQLITKALVGENLFSKKEHNLGMLYLVGVEGLLDWGVWVRNDECENWTYWRQGQVCVRSEGCCEEDDECDLRDYCSQEVDLELGDMPDEVKNARKIQFLIRWKGVASIEGIKVTHSAGDFDENSGAPDGATVCDDKCLDVRQDCIYNDYEYSSAEDRWEDRSNEQRVN